MGKCSTTFVFLWTLAVTSVTCYEILCYHSDGIRKGNSSQYKGGSATKARSSGREHARGVISEDGRYISCNKSSKEMICFAVWMRTPNGTIKMRKQSCMYMGDEICQQRTCSRSLHNPQSQIEYCCCTGRLCNANVHLAVTVKRPKSSVSLPDDGDLIDAENDDPGSHESDFTSSHLGLVLGVCALGIVLFVGSSIILFTLRHRLSVKKITGSKFRLKKSNAGLHMNGRLPSASDGSCGTTSTRLLSQNGTRQRLSQGKLLGDFSRLQLVDLIHRGKYGEVWRSKIPSVDNLSDDGDVYCVKTFSRGPQQQYFQNERDIYAMPMNCGHPNVLSCLGWDIRPSDGLAMLVLEYCPYGSLQAYLVNHPIDWKTFLRLSMGAAAGLAHLHSEFGVPGITSNLTQVVTWTSGDRKYPIVHRDVNSRNMVVRKDGTLLISDMGFAVKLAPGGNRYYNRDNEPENAEECPLQEVGTVRYMAPEVLEGFVNLRECESSLKQVDVYALALVLWELMTRCFHLYPSGNASPYMEPYWMEAGPQPDISVLTEIVVKQKLRPKLPQDWCFTQLPHRLLKDTLEESWDSDQEARLSAACILERLKSLDPNWQSLTLPASEKVLNENTPFLKLSSDSQVCPENHQQT